MSLSSQAHGRRPRGFQIVHEAGLARLTLCPYSTSLLLLLSEPMGRDQNRPESHPHWAGGNPAPQDLGEGVTESR